MRKSFQVAEAIFQQNNGILRLSHAKRLGVDEKTLSQMTEAGLLTRESLGIYRLASLSPLSYPDLTIVALRIRQGVVCLISALDFHQLTTQIPHRVYIALPRGTKRPEITYPPLKVVTLSQAAYSAGIEVHRLDAVPVNIYNKEKTIADCFKFRNLIGQDVALEALKTYFADHKPRINELLDYARLNRVEKIMHPYIELYQ
jgi:predicted transcriptional regulator of viral defense system